MRDLAFALIVIGLLPVCFRRPFIGLLVFSWLAYMRGQDLTWGFARDARWSYYVAIVTLIGFYVGERQRLFLPDLRNYMMIALVAIVGVGILLSRNNRPDAYQFARYVEFCKIVGVALFTTGVCRTREQLRVLVWVIALSLGFLGVKYGVWGILTLGRGQILQGPGGLLADNNDFSLAMAMCMPLLLNIGLSERREVLRRAFLLMVPLVVITVVLTHSRGGFLSIAGVFLVLAWRSRNRIAGLLLLVLVAIGGWIVVPSSYKERISSISTSEASAAGRLKSWAVATRMAADNPLLGVGFGHFRQHYLEYEPNPTPGQLSGKDLIVAHNSYLQIWAECGTPAFLIYLAVIAMTVLSLWRVRRRAKDVYAASWIINYANMFEASLVAFLIGSTFLNRGHFDLLYHFIAVVMIFERVALEEIAEPHKFREKGRTRGELSLAPARGFGVRLPRRGFRTSGAEG